MTWSTPAAPRLAVTCAEAARRVRSGVDLVDQAEPFASFDPLFEGRQHPLRPDRRFGPAPSGARASPACLALAGTAAGCSSVVHVRRVSTFLRPFAPPALPGFLATMGALTPVTPGLELARHSRQVSLLHVSGLRPSVSNHLTASPGRFRTLPLSARGFPALRRSGLRLSLAGSPIGPAESSSLSYGRLLHLPLLPTPPRGDAVTVGYRPESACLKRTLHPSSQTRSQTHDRARLARLMSAQDARGPKEHDLL